MSPRSDEEEPPLASNERFPRPPLRFRRFGGGYRKEDVEFALAELRLTLRQLDNDLEALRERARELEEELRVARAEVESHRGKDAELSQAMAIALRRAGEIEEAAQERARAIIASAEEAALRTRSEARGTDESGSLNELLRIKDQLIQNVRSVVGEFDEAISRAEQIEVVPQEAEPAPAPAVEFAPPAALPPEAVLSPPAAYVPAPDAVPMPPVAFSPPAPEPEPQVAFTPEPEPEPEPEPAPPAAFTPPEPEPEVEPTAPYTPPPSEYIPAPPVAYTPPAPPPVSEAVAPPPAAPTMPPLSLPQRPPEPTPEPPVVQQAPPPLPPVEAPPAEPTFRLPAPPTEPVAHQPHFVSGPPQTMPPVHDAPLAPPPVPIVPPAPVTPRPAAEEEQIFETQVELDAGPFPDFASLSAFERALAHLPRVDDVYVRRLADDRALIELTLSEPAPLVSTMRESLPYELDVRTASRTKLVINVYSHSTATH
jgi:DivIVA protein